VIRSRERDNVASNEAAALSLIVPPRCADLQTDQILEICHGVKL
jgi:hypothetical protein